MLCENGCGLEATYKQKNGKIICNSDHRKCKSNSLKYSLPGSKNPMFGRKHTNETKIIIGKKSSEKIYSKETIEKFRLRMLGSGNPMFGKSRSHSDESKEKISKSLKGKPLSEKNKIGISKALKGRIFTKEWKEKLSESAIKRITENGPCFPLYPSKIQIKLYELCKEIYPSCILEFWDEKAHKSIDIAILEHKIAIEYDGSYWHQDEEKDRKRQEKLESLGWKFIRFRDYFPTKEELERKICECGM